MGELTSSWSAEGRKNVFGNPVKVVQMQSEAGAAGSLHGVIDSGNLATTFTCSQGLLLMIPNMYIIAGQLSPAVFHVTARALSKHGLSIYAEHTDVMAVRQTGWALLSSTCVQECMDMAAIAHLASIQASIPFVHFFDGYRVSHELSKIHEVDYDSIKTLVPVDALKRFRERGLTPLKPLAKACNTGSDIFFQGTEAVNKFYDSTPSVVQEVMFRLAGITGRDYKLFEYHGPPQPDHIIVTMGSSFHTVNEVIKHVSETRRHGVLNVRLYRPWSAVDLIEAIPPTVKRITVLDRTKEAGALGEPLFLDVVATMQLDATRRNVEIFGGRYGIGAKEFTPDHVMDIIRNAESNSPRKRFTVGILDDVTFTNLPPSKNDVVIPFNGSQSVFFAMASDGTVSANHNAVNLIGSNTELYVQAHIWNDSKKAGGATVSHLRFSPDPIEKPYEINEASFVAVSEPTWPRKFPRAILKKLATGATLLLNTHCKDADMLEKVLPREFMNGIADKRIKVWTVDARKVATESGLKASLINNVMQSAFFKLALGSVLPYESKALPLLIDSVKRTYEKKGPDVTEKNVKAVLGAIEGLRCIPVPSHWSEYVGGDSSIESTSLSQKLSRMEGDDLPVSAMNPYGIFETGTTADEKRGIAASIPLVDMNKCTQCNLCSVICPHAAIRPFLLTPTENATVPGFDTKLANGGSDVHGYHYRIQVSPMDCTGCEACSWTCPDDALTMTPVSTLGDDLVVSRERENWDFLTSLPERSGRHSNRNNPKSSQLGVPLLQFSGACAGCGETPYAKLVTQLFGERMIIANASGCSGVWGGAAGSSSYTKNAFKEGPAWGRSLYEDAAEYGLGIATAIQSRRDALLGHVKTLLKESTFVSNDANPEFLQVLWKWAEGGFNNSSISQQAARSIPIYIEEELSRIDNKGSTDYIEKLQHLQELSKEFVKTTVFVFGGDGWAYDIGFGGLDHVLASGANINIVVFDTEGYANTAGQVSKATNIGAVQKFAPDGKMTPKKNLAEMAMSYGYVYVASVAIGANPSQAVRALIEAEAYTGPSLVLCYSPCIEHKILFPRGLSRLSDEMVKAVNTGYWPIFRYHPIDSKFKFDGPKRIISPVTELTALEDRFAVLHRTNPEKAKTLAAELQEFIDRQHERLLKRERDSLAATAVFENKVRILYATETGNTAELATRLQMLCESRQITAEVIEMDSIENMDEFCSASDVPVILMSSTAGDGVFPSMAERMWNLLQNVSGVPDPAPKYTVFGLGDSSYAKFNQSAKDFDSKLTALGFRLLCPAGFGDDRDPDKYETKFEEWLPGLWASVGGKEPNIDRSKIMTATITRVDTLPGNLFEKLNISPIHRQQTFELELIANRRVTPEDYERSLNNLTFRETSDSVGDLSYLLGDALTVYPRNRVEKVMEFLSTMGLKPYDAVLINSSNKQFEYLGNIPVTLVDLFGQVFDIFGRCTSRFYKDLLALLNDGRGKEELGKLIGDTAALNDRVERGVSVADVIREYYPGISLDEIINIVPQMKPRLYSIASAYREAKGAVDLLVVQHEWDTKSDNKRRGLCSEFLQNLNAGDRIVAGIASGTFHLPPSRSVPIIMAGLGSGIAPFRSFIQDRVTALRDGEPIGEIMLFYGCRYKAKDYAFREELEELNRQAVITTLSPAFSRDQIQKVYIQQRIREDAEGIFKNLIEQEGYFYLCGQAGHAVTDIERAITDALMQGGGVSEQDALGMIRKLKDENRYCVEVY
jgi:homodimeric pyruvate:ferredoxin (flavodoxin) oxidoreductase